MYAQLHISVPGSIRIVHAYHVLVFAVKLEPGAPMQVPHFQFFLDERSITILDVQQTSSFLHTEQNTDEGIVKSRITSSSAH